MTISFLSDLKWNLRAKRLPLDEKPVWMPRRSRSEPLLWIENYLQWSKCGNRLIARSRMNEITWIGSLKASAVTGRHQRERQRLDVKQIARALQRKDVQMTVRLLLLVGGVHQLIEGRETGGDVVAPSRFADSSHHWLQREEVSFKRPAVKTVATLQQLLQRLLSLLQLDDDVRQHGQARPSDFSVTAQVHSREQHQIPISQKSFNFKSNEFNGVRSRIQIPVDDARWRARVQHFKLLQEARQQTFGERDDFFLRNALDSESEGCKKNWKKWIEIHQQQRIAVVDSYSCEENKSWTTCCAVVRLPPMRNFSTRALTLMKISVTWPAISPAVSEAPAQIQKIVPLNQIKLDS